MTSLCQGNSSAAIGLPGAGRRYAAVLVLLLGTGIADAAVGAHELLAWGLETHVETVGSLQIPRSRLFAETAALSGEQSGGDGGYAYVWALSTQFRVQNALTRIHPAVYAPILRAFSDQARERYWEEFGGGYRSGVGAGATRFYDDNAHMAVALLEAYGITGDAVYLSRAEETYAFVISGEDDAGGGGVYFHVGDFGTKETIATLQGARTALLLYQATGEADYLADATRLYAWAASHTQEADGLFLEKYFLTGPQAGTAGNFALVDAAGNGILVNLAFYAATGNVARLQEAQRIAGRSLTRYFNATTGAIQDEGFWAFVLVDALCDLSRADGNPLWINRVVRALEWLQAHRRDPHGHYGTLWGRGGFQAEPLPFWHLNDQASVARAYLHTAISLIPTATTLHLELLPSPSSGSFQITLSGPSGTTGHIQRGTSLQSWSDWMPFHLGDVPLQFIDPGAADSPRFFRAISR